MVTKHTRGKITWIDLESPEHDELREVMQEYKIDARIEHEIRTPTPYPVVFSFPSYVYMILHFPTTDATGGAKNQEVDFIVSKSFIITVRYDVVESIHSLHRVFEAEELIGLSPKEQNTSHLLERMLRRLYSAIREEAEHVAHQLDQIERDIFAGKERKTVRKISEANRVLLRFERTLGRHSEVLSMFLEELARPALYGKTFATHATHITAQRTHVATIVTSYRAVAAELRQTNDSLLSASQNQVMKTLTIMSFVTFPLTFLAALFAMETSYLPIVGADGDFWIILGIMATLAISFLSFFKSRNWI